MNRTHASVDLNDIAYIEMKSRNREETSINFRCPIAPVKALP